jgi:hypothetical protein
MGIILNITALTSRDLPERREIGAFNDTALFFGHH